MIKQKTVAILFSFALIISQAGCGGLSGRDGSDGRGARTAPHFKPGFNLFSVEQDVQLGQQSAEQIARQVPLLLDEQIVRYVRALGARLSQKAGGHKFPYQFSVVATKEINAFALPGGFIFVNAGTMAAAKNEGELAGVIAHEIAHVALRHGTNQASKAYVAKTGLGILGAITGGGESDLGQIINVIGGAGANAAFLKMGRTAETQADLEGARMMAEAGYDPRDMASFFKTLQSLGGQKGPEFLSDHPDPGNRIAAINEILSSLPVRPDPVRTTPEFEQIKARLAGGRAALRSSSEPARVGPRDPNNNEPAARPGPPLASFTKFQAQDSSFAFEYPSNWDALAADDSNLIFAPKGAYGRLNETLHVTHGVFIGAVPVDSRDLESATVAFIRQQINANPDFRVVREPEAITIGGRQGYATAVAGPSTVTGVIEVDIIYTTATSDGRLFYLITIAPEDELQAYRAAFERVIDSVRLAG
jgi:Zn-dependent protease with chaperone function